MPWRDDGAWYGAMTELGGGAMARRQGVSGAVHRASDMSGMPWRDDGAWCSARAGRRSDGDGAMMRRQGVSGAVHRANDKSGMPWRDDGAWCGARAGRRSDGDGAMVRRQGVSGAVHRANDKSGMPWRDDRAWCGATTLLGNGAMSERLDRAGPAEHVPKTQGILLSPSSLALAPAVWNHAPAVWNRVSRLAVKRASEPSWAGRRGRRRREESHRWRRGQRSRKRVGAIVLIPSGPGTCTGIAGGAVVSPGAGSEILERARRVCRSLMEPRAPMEMDEDVVTRRKVPIEYVWAIVSMPSEQAAKSELMAPSSSEQWERRVLMVQIDAAEVERARESRRGERNASGPSSRCPWSKRRVGIDGGDVAVEKRCVGNVLDALDGFSGAGRGDETRLTERIAGAAGGKETRLGHRLVSLKASRENCNRWRRRSRIAAAGAGDGDAQAGLGRATHRRIE
ncbi:hypothetical protein QBC39DRAFT_436705 [Podospora conica]|nr:hypothetical protein QBC39DRAFT_436705 [Schizothecium conicum]